MQDRPLRVIDRERLVGRPAPEIGRLDVREAELGLAAVEMAVADAEADHAERRLEPVLRLGEVVVGVRGGELAGQRGRRAQPEQRIDIDAAVGATPARVAGGGERQRVELVGERALGGAREDRLERRADRDRQVPLDAFSRALAALLAQPDQLRLGVAIDGRVGERRPARHGARPARAARRYRRAARRRRPGSARSRGR